MRQQIFEDALKRIAEEVDHNLQESEARFVGVNPESQASVEATIDIGKASLRTLARIYSIATEALKRDG